MQSSTSLPCSNHKAQISSQQFPCDNSKLIYHGTIQLHRCKLSFISSSRFLGPPSFKQYCSTVSIICCWQYFERPLMQQFSKTVLLNRILLPLSVSFCERREIVDSHSVTMYMELNFAQSSSQKG